MEEHEFKPKEWVLVRDTDEQNWRLGIYSHYDKDCSRFPYRCVADNYMQCIPYEGNEHLIGTSKPAGPVEELDGWKVGDKVEVEFCWDKEWYPGEIVRINPRHTSKIDGESMPYRVKAKCFATVVGALGEAWCAKRQLRKPSGSRDEEGWFKFGDYVEVLKDNEWIIGIVTEVDKDDEFATYHVNFPEDEGWYGKSKVRKYEGKG